MRTLLDRHLFTLTDLDSASLTALGSVVHMFSEPGRYRGVVTYGGEAVGTFALHVDPDSAATQATIDLATIVEGTTGSGGATRRATFEVHPEGYVVFHVSQSAGGYAVHVGRLDEGPKPKEFDSRELKRGDIFAATLLRPGRYQIANVLGRVTGQISVSYPAMAKEAYRPPAPFEIVCRDAGFDPRAIALKPAQGLVVLCEGPTRLTITLTEPDDGPDGRGARIPTRRSSQEGENA